ncbi:unnamed protein product, partial [Discosporangium mesarthrocarpum]
MLGKIHDLAQHLKDHVRPAPQTREKEERRQVKKKEGESGSVELEFGMYRVLGIWFRRSIRKRKGKKIDCMILGSLVCAAAGQVSCLGSIGLGVGLELACGVLGREVPPLQKEWCLLLFGCASFHPDFSKPKPNPHPSSPTLTLSSMPSHMFPFIHAVQYSRS